MNSNLKVGNTTWKNNIEDILEKIDNSRNIRMPSVVQPADMRDCEHCSKKNVCKYKEKVEEAIDYLNSLDNNDERFSDIPLIIDIKCKEFSIGYTGVR